MDVAAALRFALHRGCQHLIADKLASWMRRLEIASRSADRTTLATDSPPTKRRRLVIFVPQVCPRTQRANLMLLAADGVPVKEIVARVGSRADGEWLEEASMLNARGRRKPGPRARDLRSADVRKARSRRLAPIFLPSRGLLASP